MSAFVKKEVRLLLPGFVSALLLAFSTLLVADAPIYTSFFRTSVVLLPFFICPALILMMALSSFGSEISTGTFSHLLSQPISRHKIWRTKTLLLAIAIAVIWFVWVITFSGSRSLPVDASERRFWLEMTILFSLVVFSGSLWSVLLFRQVAAAFWFTILVPAALMMPVFVLSEKYSQAVEPVLVTILSLYSVAGFLFARHLFLRAQDVAWSGGVIALPQWRKAKAIGMKSKTRRGTRPLAALFWKEIQLHQSQLVVAGVLALLHLVVVLVRNFGGEFAKHSVMEFVLEGFFVLWFVTPMLIGCAAVSEERKLGTLECQLCLPVRRRTQFWIKFSSALLLSVVFGFFMPLLFEGKRIFWEIEIKAISELAQNFKGDVFIRDLIHILRVIGELLPILIHLGIIAVILTVSFYASTLSRNTLQSLAPALLGIIVAFTVFIGADNVEKIFSYPLWRGWLIYIIGVPVLTLAIYALMEWNFKQVWINWRVGRRNATVWVAVVGLVMVSTTAIYHRVWELLTPLEPAHGVARLEKSADHKMESWGWRSTIQLADGRAWSAWPSFGAPDFAAVFLGDWDFELKSGEFWKGTDWASVASSYFDDVGIKDDGSLWVSQEPRKPSEGRKERLPARPLIRVGNDQDWKSVLFEGRRAVLLKKDGTLWNWGEHENKGKTEWQGLNAFQPERLGRNSDWSEISKLRDRAVLKKGGGETWVFQKISSNETNSIKLNEKVFLWRAEQWDGLESVVGVFDRFRSFGNLQVGTDKDRKILITGGWERTRREHALVKKRIPLNKESGWLAVAGEGEMVMALKDDGTLWKWKFTDDPITKPESASVVRLGKHSDWIAIADQFGGVTSLAADGSLWFWRSDDPRYSSASAQTIPPLLAASRRPLRIGNIFDAPGTP